MRELMVMQCPKCGAGLSPDATECEHCGVALQQRSNRAFISATEHPCPNPECDWVNAPDDRFCRLCGTRLLTSCPSCATDIWVDQIYCDHCGRNVAEGRRDKILVETAGPLPHEVLGVDRYAGMEEIDAAYEAKCDSWHRLTAHADPAIAAEATRLLAEAETARDALVAALKGEPEEESDTLLVEEGQVPTETDNVPPCEGEPECPYAPTYKCDRCGKLLCLQHANTYTSPNTGPEWRLFDGVYCSDCIETVATEHNRKVSGDKSKAMAAGAGACALAACCGCLEETFRDL
jgi:hypothetical protein